VTDKEETNVQAELLAWRSERESIHGDWRLNSVQNS